MKNRGQPELNRRPLDLQSNALPLSYTPIRTVASFQLFLGGGQKFFWFFNATGLSKNWKKQHFICSILTLFIVPFFLSFFFSFFFSLFSFFSFFFLFFFFLFPWGGRRPPSPPKWRPCIRIRSTLLFTSSHCKSNSLFGHPFRNDSIILMTSVRSDFGAIVETCSDIWRMQCVIISVPSMNGDTSAAKFRQLYELARESRHDGTIQ